MPKKGKVSIEGFEIFETIRTGKLKGGTMIGAHKGLKPVLISELNDPFEILVIEIEVGNKEIRIMSGYGPQESWTSQQREPFFRVLEEEIVKATLAGKAIIIEADFNSKLGRDYIPSDPHGQDRNGKLLSEIIKRQNLTVANGLVVCKGTITRKRVTTQRTEESAISFVLVSEDLVDKIDRVVIDEEREHVLTRLTKTKNGTVIKESDHNVIKTSIKLSWSKRKIPKPEALFNLKNKKCQKIFKDVTSNNNKLSKVFDEVDDLDKATEIFMKKLNKAIHKCFKKIGQKKEKENTKYNKLYNRWKLLKKKDDPESRTEMELLEDELADEYFEKVLKASNNIDVEDGANMTTELWKLKKQICTRNRDPPTAMLNKDGNLVTDEDEIKQMALSEYKERLKNRPMKEGLKHVQVAKERLADNIMEKAKLNKTPPWDMKDIELVLGKLKKDKSRDPNGLANELFKVDAAGSDLKEAILKLMNRIKSEQKYPMCLELCNITSIWKLKGPRNQFSSYRGIFRVSIFRAILDRLIYNDEIENIDSNLTDSNVGARRKRNIRDNIFVLNAVINSQKKKHEEALDIQVYDVEKCFDSLWLKEVISCLYEAGLQNDKLPLLFLENRNAQVAVKTWGGISERASISEIIMQGSVWGSICCVALMDKLGKYVYEHKELQYYYKGLVGCPPLQMVDDILTLQTCSKANTLNTVVNTFMELEKLTLSKSKCHKLHLGNKVRQCNDMKVHGETVQNSKTEKYLGDLICNNGSNKPNIAKRLSRGWGRVSDILAIVSEAPLGRWRIASGLVLRKSLLINSILFNSEAWHNLSQGQVEAFEKIDEALIRSLVIGHAKIPVPALYLECGQLPISRGGT